MKKIKLFFFTALSLIALTFIFFNFLTSIFPSVEAAVILDSEGRGTITDDRDGKAYKVTKIGEQIWMAENLNYDRGKSIGKCYDNDPVNCEKYGRLYNWNEAMKVCPKDWHLPSYEEWQMPYAYLGGGKEAINKLKAKNDWEKGNGTDDYGFLALPSGYYDESYDEFQDIGIAGYWWSTTEFMDKVKYASMYSDDDSSISGLMIEENKESLMSVRCIKNNR
ncbi:MAG: fibrobacter succinogenes major paralogous domain-containing protein [Fibromonadales bacterium]|nr:fibrobacter succinogenes major paralogous domain-containing protein [Fibromonadales bacterium]